MAVYITDRKRAAGLGSARTGAEDHWRVTVISYALILLVPLFVFTFGFALRGGYVEALAYYQRPIPALIAGLTLVVSMVHFRQGCQNLIVDYTGGHTRKILLIAMILAAYAIAALALLAVVWLAV